IRALALSERGIWRLDHRVAPVSGPVDNQVGAGGPRRDRAGRGRDWPVRSCLLSRRTAGARVADTLVAVAAVPERTFPSVNTPYPRTRLSRPDGEPCRRTRPICWNKRDRR